MSLPRPLGEEVRRELGRFGPEAALGDVVAAWPDAVGETIAANAWPARIARDGTLHVAASSSAWAFELTQLESTIVERLGGRLGKVAPARIRFALGLVPERGGENAPASERTVPEVTAALVEEGARIAAGIQDPDLRAAVARAAAASLAVAIAGRDDRPV